MAVVRADLARLPAGDGEVAVLLYAEDILDVLLGVPLLFALYRYVSLHAGLLPALEAIIDITFRQMLIPRRYSVDELFDDVTRVLT